MASMQTLAWLTCRAAVDPGSRISYRASRLSRTADADGLTELLVLFLMKDHRRRDVDVRMSETTFIAGIGCGEIRRSISA